MMSTILVALALTGCGAKTSTLGSLNVNGANGLNAPQEVVYKTVNGHRLTLHVYSSSQRKPNELSPAIVFFFGGGWSTGTPKQFENQAVYLASRGMVAITADYRVRSRHLSQVVDSVSDARSAIRWVRANARKFNVDPQRIAAGGGSAGGHLAACTAWISEFDDPVEDSRVSAAPNALLLFNPALVLAELPGTSAGMLAAVPKEDVLGASAARLSPAHHVARGGPPTVIFHGDEDRTVPVATARLFADKMVDKGNSCKLRTWPGQGHGFFNQEPYFTKTLIATDEFFGQLGWIKGKPTLRIPN